MIKEDKTKNKFLACLNRRSHLNKRGAILAGNIIFIVLNLVFLSILIIFLYNQGSGIILLEETYAKQIALMIDSSEPGMIMFLNMEKAFDVAEKEKRSWQDVVKVDNTNNIVTIKLNNEEKRKGYQYSFFNDVEVDIFEDEKNKGYSFTIK